MNPLIKKIVEEAWQTPENNFYNITSTQNKEVTTNKDSYYGHLLPDEDFSIDISNQKMLASLDERGTIKISVFSETRILLKINLALGSLMALFKKRILLLKLNLITKDFLCQREIKQ
ncbi:hypothetical protein SDC49_11325 [Lactobacillus sp. R2/2]|nr:hypothetical protein [Lactobacillus sp. R2/2]